MVTKAGGAENQQRLLRLCLDLQPYTFKVIHRSGISHLDADAVSRLLGKDDQPYVRSENELRDDNLPLTLSEMEAISSRYGTDAKVLEPIINEGRRRIKEIQEETAHSVKKLKQNAIKFTNSDDKVDSLTQIVKDIERQRTAENEMKKKAKISYIEQITMLIENYTQDENVYLMKMDSYTKFNKFSNVKIEPIQVQYEHDLEWLKKQQNKEYSLEISRYKRLPQLTSKTLEKFLNEPKIQYKTKSIVKKELEKRERARRNWKSMKTTLLEEYVQKLPSGEEFDAVNEWNRRRVTKNEGRMKEWSDGKLDGYITMLRANETMINEKECVKLQQNMMVTRGVRRKSNEKMIEMIEKLEAF
jgi:hypothetical protein